MAFLLAGDAISGKEGSVYANIGGRVIECAEIVSLSATVTKTKVEFRALGFSGTQHKATGHSGAGTATIYYVTSVWNAMMLEYMRTRRDSYFDIVVTNDDPGSSIGIQRIKLGMCNLDSLEIARIDVNADFLTSTFPFTFSTAELLDSFAPLPL